MVEVFGGYRLHRTINVGSIGEVFLAERIADAPVRRHGDAAPGAAREPLVVKRLHRELARRPEHIELFREEGRLARGLRHANLVAGFDAGLVGADHYIALELVRGPNLLQLEVLGPTDVARALTIAVDVAAGLEHVHATGLVHCDVSPTNVLAGPRRAQLTDFGVATLAGHPQRAVRGTFGYMSPEQARGESLDARSDVFSLAVVLWELLTHRPLFQRRERYLTLAAVVEDAAPPLGAPALTPLEPILACALAKDPADRFASARALATALRQATGEGPEAGSTSPGRD